MEPLGYSFNHIYNRNGPPDPLDPKSGFVQDLTGFSTGFQWRATNHPTKHMHKKRQRQISRLPQAIPVTEDPLRESYNILGAEGTLQFLADSMQSD